MTMREPSMNTFFQNGEGQNVEAATHSMQAVTIVYLQYTSPSNS